VGSCGLDESDPGYGPVDGSCEHGNEPLCSMQHTEFLVYLCDLSFQGLCSMQFVIMKGLNK